MRVLMTADTVGGVWTYALELIAALDCDVTLATMGAPLTRAQARAAAAIAKLDVVSSSFALEWMPDPWRDVDAAGDWLLAIERKVAPDVVHLNGYAHAVLPFRAPVVVVAHSCVCSWYRAVRGCEAPGEWDEYRRRVAAGLAAADQIVAPTAAVLDAVLDAHRVTASGRVIANGRSAWAWGPADKDPYVLAAGRMWDEANGLADLDACASRLKWPIYVAGPTTAPAGIARVQPSGVRLLGELSAEQLAARAARAAIYALPARYEPFGRSIVEAALAGCALVLGGIDMVREIWRDDALYVQPGDVAALATTLQTLANDPLRRRALGAAARARAMSLTPQRMAASYRALYAELLGAKAVA